MRRRSMLLGAAVALAATTGPVLAAPNAPPQTYYVLFHTPGPTWKLASASATSRASTSMWSI
jgi:hypothetical protein